MLTFDIEQFIGKHVTHREESLLKADYLRHADTLHERIDGKREIISHVTDSATRSINSNEDTPSYSIV